MSLRTDLAQIYNLLLHGNTALTGANQPSVQRSEREIANYMSGDLLAHRVAFPVRYLFAPANASATAILNATVLQTTAQNIVPNSQPDFPRFLVAVSVSGQTGNVVVTGTDFGDNVISDTIALSAATPVNGTKAFKTITSVALPVRAAPGNTVSLGTLNTFGLPHKMAHSAMLIYKRFNDATDSGTVTLDADLSKNVIALNGTPDGAKKVDLLYYV